MGVFEELDVISRESDNDEKIKAVYDWNRKNCVFRYKSAEEASSERIPVITVKKYIYLIRQVILVSEKLRFFGVRIAELDKNGNWGLNTKDEIDEEIERLVPFADDLENPSDVDVGDYFNSKTSDVALGTERFDRKEGEAIYVDFRLDKARFEGNTTPSEDKIIPNYSILGTLAEDIDEDKNYIAVESFMRGGLPHFGLEVIYLPIWAKDKIFFLDQDQDPDKDYEEFSKSKRYQRDVITSIQLLDGFTVDGKIISGQAKLDFDQRRVVWRVGENIVRPSSVIANGPRLSAQETYLDLANEPLLYGYSKGANPAKLQAFSESLEKVNGEKRISDLKGRLKYLSDISGVEPSPPPARPPTPPSPQPPREEEEEKKEPHSLAPEVKQLEEENQELKTENTKLKLQINAKDAEISRLETSLIDLGSERQLLTNRNMQLQLENTNLLRKNRILREQSGGQNKTPEEPSAAEPVDPAEPEIYRLSLEIEETKRRLDKVFDKIDVLKEKPKKNAADINLLQGKAKALLAHDRDLQQRRAKLRNIVMPQLTFNDTAYRFKILDGVFSEGNTQELTKSMKMRVTFYKNDETSTYSQIAISGLTGSVGESLDQYGFGIDERGEVIAKANPEQITTSNVTALSSIPTKGLIAVYLDEQRTIGRYDISRRTNQGIYLKINSENEVTENNKFVIVNLQRNGKSYQINEVRVFSQTGLDF